MPKMRRENIFYDVDCGEINNKECWCCGEILEFYVDDFLGGVLSE